MSKRHWLSIAILTMVAVAAGCATPGDQVRVSTMSVEDAWNGKPTTEFTPSVSKVINPGIKTTPPYPIITSPDIRLAYMKPWTDSDGSRHFGNWIAIQIDNPKWVLPDGSLESTTEPLPPAQTFKKRR